MSKSDKEESKKLLTIETVSPRASQSFDTDNTSQATIIYRPVIIQKPRNILRQNSLDSEDSMDETINPHSEELNYERL